MLCLLTSRSPVDNADHTCFGGNALAGGKCYTRLARSDDCSSYIDVGHQGTAMAQAQADHVAGSVRLAVDVLSDSSNCCRVPSM